MEEMDKELIETTTQQIEENVGQINQITEQIKQLTEQVNQFAIQVNQVALQVNQLMEDVKQIYPGQVKQQVRRQLCPEPVKQFEKQCIRRLEANEYDGRQSIGVSTAILCRLYEVWCEIQGIACMPQKNLTMEIKKLGYRKDRGKCLVKSYATGQAADRQQIIYYYVPKTEDRLLQAKIHEKLLECDCPQDSEEYQQLHALEVWFNKEGE